MGEGGIEDLGTERHCCTGSRQEGQSRDRSGAETGPYQHRGGGVSWWVEDVFWGGRLRCGWDVGEVWLLVGQTGVFGPRFSNHHGLLIEIQRYDRDWQRY